MSLIVVLLCGLVFGSHAFVLHPKTSIDVEVKEAKKAFEATNEFLDKAADSASQSLFDKVMMYGSATGFMLKSAKELVDIAMILTGTQGESKELKFMKEQFAVINNKLDALDFEFRELHRHIDWNTMRINVGEYEAVITSLEGYLDLIMDSPSDTRSIFKEMFVKAYRHNSGNSAEKIYLSAIADATSAIFQENIFDVARKFYGNDLRKLSGFVGYIMRTIQRSLVLETTFFRLTNNSAGIHRSQSLWETRFRDMAKAAKKIEARLLDAVPKQYREDVEKLVLEKAEARDNAGLSKEIYAHLSAKFPFRSWFVLTYSKTDSNKDRFLDNCGEYIRTIGGKVVVVTSRKKEASSPDLSKVFSKVYKLAGMFQPFGDVAKSVFEKKDDFSCATFRFKGVIAGSVKPAVVSDEKFTSIRSVYAILAPVIPKKLQLIAFG